MPWPSSAVNSGPRRLSQAHGITETCRNSQPTCSAASCSSPADRPDVQSQAQKLSPDEDELLKLVHRWRNEAAQAGRGIKRIVIAYEGGHDGFWLARWLRRHGIESYVIHPSSVAVSREHRRAKTDRLDTELLMRAFLGWLRGEPDHAGMAAVPTLEEAAARRRNRERESLVGERPRIVNRIKGALARLGIRGF